MPKISVVMPAYNAENYIAESIRSFTCQTFEDFELIVIDDGSADATPSIIKSIDDTRIRYFRLPSNSGTANAVNAGYDMAGGEFIAHMDADDIAMPERLELQFEFLTQNPHITVLGSTMECFGEHSGRVAVPSGDAQIKACFLPGFGNVLNPTAMFRREFIEKNKLRCEPELKGAFDWGFWVKIMQWGGTFANLAHPLLRYRSHPAQQSRGNQRNLPELTLVRHRILDLFYPELSVSDKNLLEPLVTWNHPPILEYQKVKTGLEVLESALLLNRRSFVGEDRVVLDNFLKACRADWQKSISNRQTAQQTG